MLIVTHFSNQMGFLSKSNTLIKIFIIFYIFFKQVVWTKGLIELLSLNSLMFGLLVGYRKL